MQKTASLYFCTPEKIFDLLSFICPKNRFALFLHSGKDFRFTEFYLSEKPLRSIFALRKRFSTY
ncbi:Uncharacterized protein dnm_026550 [Desulfonema magnum]|uniref:Uncharacterized protein n=1 Tax=Desulfonema magnum TaxID=45655 RepID=A0A975BJT7_9BACT|nr:Uncharacterized protein dnm_026550 [Desulfonema magnum]